MFYSLLAPTNSGLSSHFFLITRPKEDGGPHVAVEGDQQVGGTEEKRRPVDLVVGEGVNQVHGAEHPGHLVQQTSPDGGVQKGSQSLVDQVGRVVDVGRQIAHLGEGQVGLGGRARRCKEGFDNRGIQ